MPFLGREHALGVERGHRAGAGGGHRLAVCVVDDVTRGEDAGDVRPGRSWLDDEVPRRVVLELVEEEARVGIVADRDEEPLRGDLSRLARVQVADEHRPHLAFLAEHLVDDRVRDELDLRVGPRAVEHDRRGTELVAAVDDVHLLRELRQEDRLFHRRVSAADDHDVLLLEEGGVADGAVRDAASLERPLGLEPELARARAGCDDHRPRPVLVAVHLDGERTLGEVDRRHVFGQELCAEALGLRTEVLHHLRAEDAFGIARVVLDVARDHELAAEHHALRSRVA